MQYDGRIETAGDGRCPGGDVELSLVSGALPSGLHLAAAGISGVPGATGYFHFVIRAANQCRWAIQKFDLSVTTRPLLVVSTDWISFVFEEGDTTPQRKSVKVSAGWPDLAYTASAQKAWLKLAPLTGRTPPAGSPLSGDELAIEVSAANLAPGSYSTKVDLSAWEAALTPSVEVAVTVLPKK